MLEPKPAKEPGEGGGFGEKFKSRKLRALLLNVIIGFVGERFGLPKEVTEWLLQIGFAYIGSQGIADFGAQGMMASGSDGKKKSMKFLVYLLFSVLTAAGNFFEVPPEVLEWMVNGVSVWLVSQGVADAGWQGLKRLPVEEQSKLKEDHVSPIPPVGPGKSQGDEPSLDVEDRLPGKSPLVDGRSRSHLDKLPPLMADLFEDVLLVAKGIASEFGADVKIISSVRTFEEQDKLYAQGRTSPGAIVTNAKGGESYHNYGLAVDFGVFQGKAYLDASDPDTSVQVYQKLNEWIKGQPEDIYRKIEWGGDWESMKDYPHFQFDPGYSLAELKKKKEKGEQYV